MASTPNSSQGAGLDGAGGGGDKKRNKLGYHRTSVACVHCRRRKIRCLMAADDAQRRCENCIRLRKECQFFPVDQQPPVEKKPRPTSRLETPQDCSTATPISSSPTIEPFYPYQAMPLNTSGQDMSSFNAAAIPVNPAQGFTPERPMGPGDYPGLDRPMDPGVPWDEFTTMSEGQMMNMPPNAWNMPATSPMPQPLSQAQPMNPQPGFAMQPDGSVWPVPQPPSRAMTYPGQEMGQLPPQMPPDLRRRMTTPAQPETHPHGSHSPRPDMQTPPGSVSYASQPPMGLPTWQDINAVPGMMPYVFAGDPAQQPPYTSSPPPMGPPGAPGRSSGP